jgi:hypothetical protein
MYFLRKKFNLSFIHLSTESGAKSTYYSGYRIQAATVATQALPLFYLQDVGTIESPVYALVASPVNREYYVPYFVKFF